jgi:hypothetical protein
MFPIYAMWALSIISVLIICLCNRSCEVSLVDIEHVTIQHCIISVEGKYVNICPEEADSYNLMQRLVLNSV